MLSVNTCTLKFRKAMIQTQGYGVVEEIANAISHGIAILLSVAGLTLLVTLAWQQDEPIKVISFAIYGTSLIVLFTASTLYHSLTNERAKLIFKLLDHCAIYLLIAGSYTPLMLVTLANDLGYFMVTLIWGIAVCGIIFKVKFGNKFRRLSLITYLGMGFIAVTILPELNAKLATEGLGLLILGGIIYGLGTIFYVKKDRAYSHAIWHCFVVIAALCHFFMMLFYVL